MTEVFEFMESEERSAVNPGGFSVRRMCRWLGVSRSWYCDRKRSKATVRDARREQLTRLVRRSFEGSDGTYGYRRVHAELVRWGQDVCDQSVRRLMRSEGLVPCQPRPWRPVTTIAGVDAGVPDLVGRDFTASAPGCKWVGDITYIETWQGWVYLATVLDCFSKKVVGYAMADHMRTDLVEQALRKAVATASYRPGVTIFHSDRGTQYTSKQFAEVTDALKVRRSMGRTGVCWDNAWAESFNGTLKNERCHRTQYPTREHAVRDITRYIELRYNQIRLHSALGYRTPNEAEQAWRDTSQAA